MFKSRVENVLIVRTYLVETRVPGLHPILSMFPFFETFVTFRYVTVSYRIVVPKVEMSSSEI